MSDTIFPATNEHAVARTRHGTTRLDFTDAPRPRSKYESPVSDDTYDPAVEEH